MQLHNDPLHIVNLNTNEAIHLAEGPEDGSKLLAGLIARKVSGPASIPKLGVVEIETILDEGIALLHLLIDRKPTCWATFVCGSPDAKLNWQDAHEFYHSFLHQCQSLRSLPPLPPMPEGPWMTLTFVPRCLTILSPEQVSLAVAALWGITWEIRRNG